MERGPKTVDPTMVNISLVLVSRSINLIKVSGGKPSHPQRRLLAEELGKEHVFARGVGGAVDRCELEDHVGRSYTDHGGQAIRSVGDVGCFN